MIVIDPDNDPETILAQLDLIASRYSARVVTNDRWRKLIRYTRAARTNAHDNATMMAVAVDEACRVRQLVLDICHVAGGFSAVPAVTRLSTIIGMAAEALDPDTVR